MNASIMRLCGYAGLIGASAMFAGDMLFYGQWGSGGDAQTGSLEIVQRSAPQRLAIGGLTSIIGGVGYVLGACHIYGKLAARPAWLRFSITGGFLGIAVIATATHAVWGSFALALAAGAANTALIDDYLSIHFRIGAVVGTPASILLAVAIVSRRSEWPQWFALVNPGAIYFLLSSASYMPAPLGAPIVGGAFNLAFALFYGVSIAQSHLRSRS